MRVPLVGQSSGYLPSMMHRPGEREAEAWAGSMRLARECGGDTSLPRQLDTDE